MAPGGLGVPICWDFQSNPRSPGIHIVGPWVVDSI